MRHDTRRKRLPRCIGAAALAGLLLALAGCGGGHDDNQAGNGSDAAQSDSFIAQVKDLIGTSSETTEPVSTDAVTATSPEQSEPVPLG